jgi:hypothetical protein
MRHGVRLCLKNVPVIISLDKIANTAFCIINIGYCFATGGAKRTLALPDASVRAIYHINLTFL